MIKCPFCGKSNLIINYSTSTCMYCPPVYKDGEWIFKDHNIHTMHCTCLECGKAFDSNDTLLSEDEAKKLVETMNNPPKPNEPLKELMTSKYYACIRKKNGVIVKVPFDDRAEGRKWISDNWDELEDAEAWTE